MRLLRTAGSLSRQEMAERLGLSKNTVSVIVQKWIGSGIIREGSPEDAGGVGRPRIPLQLIPGRFQAVGLVVGMSSIRYTVTDYGALVLEEDRRSVQGLSPKIT
ncbi:winged helix-turn-helix transcriptional regulator [Paenibacillus sp. CC-CFT747]|nr:winged helix-turn-helix transcriptional regulator [Paenibacillus sp. CC-CFT747]